MKHKVLLGFLAAAFLFFSVITNHQMLKSSWVNFLSGGLTLIFLQTLIINYWTLNNLVTKVWLSCYLLWFSALCLLKSGIAGALSEIHQVDSLLNYSLDAIKSPIPLMVILISIRLSHLNRVH